MATTLSPCALVVRLGDFMIFLFRRVLPSAVRKLFIALLFLSRYCAAFEASSRIASAFGSQRIRLPVQ